MVQGPLAFFRVRRRVLGSRAPVRAFHVNAGLAISDASV